MIHILQVLGTLICLHAIYPKGVTYGDKDGWEHNAKKRQEGAKRVNRRSSRPARPERDPSRKESGRKKSGGDRVREKRSERTGNRRRPEGRRYRDEARILG